MLPNKHPSANIFPGRGWWGVWKGVWCRRHWGGVNLPCGWYCVRGQPPSTRGQDHTHTHTASLWHFSQSSVTWTRRCILADGFFLFRHCLLRYLLVRILLSLIKLTSNHFHLSHSHMNNWFQRARVYEFVHSHFLNILTHTFCSVITYYTSYHLPIGIIIAYYTIWSYTYKLIQSLVRTCLYEFGQLMLTVQVAISQLFSTNSHIWIYSIIS